MRRARAANPYEYGGISVRKFLACVPRARSQNSARWPLRLCRPDERDDIHYRSRTARRMSMRSSKLQAPCIGARRDLALIEWNILMILPRNRVPVTRGHRTAVDRPVDLLLPGHPGRLLFLGRRLGLFRSRIFGRFTFRSPGFRRGRGRCGRSSSAARRALRQRDAGRQDQQGNGQRRRHRTGPLLHRKLRFQPNPFRADTITSAAARIPGFWRHGRRRTGCS